MAASYSSSQVQRASAYVLLDVCTILWTLCYLHGDLILTYIALFYRNPAVDRFTTATKISEDPFLFESIVSEDLLKQKRMIHHDS